MTPETMAEAQPGPEEVCAIAESHGLHLEPAGVEFNEAGLDYRVAFATEKGKEQKWVLRVPRRPDVAAGQPGERAILDFVRPQLGVAVPDWQIQEADLVAYPLLPGRPGLTVGQGNQPDWHFDPSSAEYLESLAELIASLHSLDTAAAAAAGIRTETPEQVRGYWANALDNALAEFRIDPGLLDGWRRWLDDDGLWPQRTVLTHGELYPAHLLLDESDRIVSVLDWTTAKVSDPALEFMYVQLISPDSFDEVVRRCQDAAGTAEPRLAERCTALIAAGPLNYAMFALATGQPEHREAAQAQLLAV
ncbi:macrolide 2'-phosphotransferase [Arthrobacter sp. NPDC055585]